MRRTLLVVPVFFAVGFAFLSTPVHAAGSLDTLPGQDTVALKQALDLLGTVLNQIDARLDPIDPDPMILANVDDISANLSDIQSQLLSINGTLANLSVSGRTISKKIASKENPVASINGTLAFFRDGGRALASEPTAKGNPLASGAPKEVVFEGMFVHLLEVIILILSLPFILWASLGLLRLRNKLSQESGSNYGERE